MLADIEIAQTLQSETEKALAEEKVEDVPHPVDQNYNSLKCSLELLDGATEEFKVRRLFSSWCPSADLCLTALLYPP